MQNKIGLVFMTIALLVAIANSGDSNSNMRNSLGVSGTLIVAVNTRDGLIIGADKRTYDRIRGDLDKSNKILLLGKHTTFSLTGSGIFLDDRTFQSQYNAEDIVRTFYHNTDPKIPASFTQLAYRLAEEFKSYLARLQFFQWPADGNPPDSALYQLAFFQYDTSSAQYQIHTLRFLYKKLFPNQFIEIRNQYAEAEKFTHSKLLWFGNTAVIDEIMSGKDPRFNDLRQRQDIERFLLHPVDYKHISKEEATEFITYFIHECSKRTPLIDTTPYHIGPTVDIAIIDKTNGVQWLARGASYKHNTKD